MSDDLVIVRHDDLQWAVDQCEQFVQLDNPKAFKRLSDALNPVVPEPDYGVAIDHYGRLYIKSDLGGWYTKGGTFLTYHSWADLVRSVPSVKGMVRPNDGD